MRLKRISSLLQCAALLGALVTGCGSAWAGSCAYIGTGTNAGGTGMGGTGASETGTIAEGTGTGMGGTGIRLGVYMTEMQVAGSVTAVQGAVEARSNGRSRLLAKGDPVCVGETISTSQSGSVLVKMADDGLIAVRPKAQLKIEKFVYSGTNKDRSLLALLKGACRVVSGKIGTQYPQNNLVRTPTSTIDVRGADHETMVILPGETDNYPSGTYDKVNKDSTLIRTDKGELDIHPNQVGFAADMGEPPTLLQEIPSFYNADSSMKLEGSSSK